VSAFHAALADAERILLDGDAPTGADLERPLADALLDGCGPAELPALAALAHRVRVAYAGPAVEVESILSARTGACSEDCAFCSQAARFHALEAEAMLRVDDVLAAARSAAEAGADHFCIVCSGYGPTPRVLARVIECVDAIHEHTSMRVATSLGILRPGQAEALAAHGVHRYNHNLEACRSFFPTICSTHTYDDRVRTLEMAREAGLELCSGGILGLGETPAQRLDLAFELRDLRPDEVPLNFLNPRPGTPLGDRATLAPYEALTFIGLFRLVLPSVVLRYAGGREVVLRDLQAMGLIGGANALIIGNYLTTVGRTPEEDLRMIADLGQPVTGALAGPVGGRGIVG
jgi:biotin synthase